MVQNIGYPDFITDPAKLDEKYQNVSREASAIQFILYQEIKTVMVLSCERQYIMCDMYCCFLLQIDISLNDTYFGTNKKVIVFTSDEVS